MPKEMNPKAKFVHELLDTNISEKRAYEPDWNLNISFYMGDQWKRAKKLSGKLVDIENGTNEKRWTQNYIKPTLDIITARATSPTPIITPIPQTGYSDDIAAARIAKLVAEAELWQRQDIPIEMQKMIPVMGTMGSVVLHPYFNARAGMRYSADYVNKMMGWGPENANRWTEDQWEGAVETDFLTPFELSRDLSARDDRSCAHWIISKPRTRQWIRNIYGVEVKQQEKTVRISEAYSKYKRDMDKGYDVAKLEDSVMVHELWHKAGTVMEGGKEKEYPNGILRAITDDGEILFDGELPWGLGEINELPFIKIDYQNFGDRFWGIPPVSDARNPQRQINKTLSMFMTFIYHYMFPPILNPEGNGIDEEQIVNRPMEFINFINDLSENGGAPHFLQMPVFNPQILDNIAISKAHIDNIFGVHDVSRATAPSGQKSGRALAILDAADDTRMHTLQTNIEIGMSKWASMSMYILAKTYSIPRLVKIVGQPNAQMIKNFTGADLRGNTDIKIKLRPFLPLNKTAALQEVQMMWQNGLIPQDQKGREMAHRMLDMETILPFYEGSKDAEQAQYENSLLDEGFIGEQIQVMEPLVNPETGEPAMNEQGQPIMRPVTKYSGLPVNPWDNDEAHIKILDERRKSIDYMRLAAENPQVKMAYDIHYDLHNQRILQAQEMQEQAQVKQAMRAIELEVYKESLLEQNKAMAQAKADMMVNRDKNRGEMTKEILISKDKKKEGEKSKAEKKEK